MRRQMFLSEQREVFGQTSIITKLDGSRDKQLSPNLSNSVSKFNRESNTIKKSPSKFSTSLVIQKFED